MTTARIRTHHRAPEIVAAAIKPDNTAEMETVVDDTAVVTAIERSRTSGLGRNCDDYLVNLQVATRLASPTETETHSTTQPTENEQ